MLYPAIGFFAIVSVALIVAGGMKRSRGHFAALSVLLWLASLLSAFFVGLAWLDRSYSENWALLGVLFISLPIGVADVLLAMAALIVMSVRGVERRRPVRLSLYILLVFLAAQALVGIGTA